jgi:hypothetical protein
MKTSTAGFSGLLLVAAFVPAAAQTPRTLLPIEFQNSAEFGWLLKPVLATRVLDDMRDPRTWAFQGTGTITFRTTGDGRVDDDGRVVDDRRVDINRRVDDVRLTGDSPMLDDMRVLRVDLQMFADSPAPTRNRLSSINLRRAFDGEDWSAYNRISMWLRADVSGFPMLPLQIVLHNTGAVTLPDAYHREGTHYVTLQNGKWQHVVWEITPLARDRITMLEIGYWVNKMLAAPGDRVAFEIGRIELQRVEPDHYEGWSVAPGRIAFSHTGYQTGSGKTAFASDLAATSFRLIRLDDNALAEVAFTGPVRTVRTRLGEYQHMDFSAVRQPGSYIIQAGETHTRPFRIADDVWRGTMLKALNFFYGQRCGFAVPGSHDVDHRDWFATHGDQRIVMNGGWHDAGDLSQGVVNTGEAVYAMFALAQRLQASGSDPELLELLLDEAKWGLDWVLRVRFAGGYRIGFASHNLWTNGIIGDADDRTREARNNPNVNYIAASAAAIAYRVLKDRDPELAARSLAVAEDDWRHAIVGVEGPETWSTPAFAASPVELAGIGVIASLELYEATGAQKYADKAIELGRVIAASQQKSFVGPDYPLAGFFFTGPDRQTLFSQFHRGNDQAAVVAMSRLATAFPDHPEWMTWYAVVALYAEYQKAAARTTQPYGVLPAYVYRDSDYLQVPEAGALHMATREAFREQVLHGMPMGDGWYLRAFPVWFARRGNFGVLLSQAKALSAAAHLLRDRDAAELAQQQAQWIVGRNPFVQSTMYGEGYDWAQQYAVSSGDFVGALPVGIQSRGATDFPYWPSQNMYVYKEAWVHPVSRWLWLMQDIAGAGSVDALLAPGAAPQVALTDQAGRTLSLDAAADGRTRAMLPEGRYTVRAGDQRAAVTVLPGGSYVLDLRPGRAAELSLTAETAANGRVTLRLTAVGNGQHTFALRAENLAVDTAPRRLTLRPGRPATVEWTARPRQGEAPWVAVLIADGTPADLAPVVSYGAQRN